MILLLPGVAADGVRTVGDGNLCTALADQYQRRDAPVTGAAAAGFSVTSRLHPVPCVAPSAFSLPTYLPRPFPPSSLVSNLWL